MPKKVQLFDNSPYMKAWAEVATDGTVTTFVRTGEAALALPYRHEKNGQIYVVLLEQERSEVGHPILKTPGGYLRPEETADNCVLRNLRAKLGIAAEAKYLVRAGSTVGYTTVQVPIRLFFLPRWERVAEPAAGCKLLEVSLEEAVELALSNAVGDDCTKEVIFRLALAPWTNRAVFRDAHAGEDVGHYIAELLALTHALEVSVVGFHNDVRFLVKSSDDIESVLASYLKRREGMKI